MYTHKYVYTHLFFTNLAHGTVGLTQHVRPAQRKHPMSHHCDFIQKRAQR